MHLEVSREPRKCQVKRIFFCIALLSVLGVLCASYGYMSPMPKMTPLAMLRMPSITRLSNTTVSTDSELTDMSKQYIVYVEQCPGRMGNLMFQYASLFGIAKRNNRSAVVNTRRYNALWEIFNNLTISRGTPPERSAKWARRKYGTYYRDTEQLPDSNVTLFGYFQSWKYFAGYESQIRQQFTFKDSILAEARDYLKKISMTYNVTAADGNLTFVGVHVRRGDRLSEKLANRYLVASKSYIVKAMNAFRRNFTRVHFVVCSDGISWCREKLGRQKNVSFSESKSYGVDIAIMSLCNHTLTTVGTFGWWAGWLAGGVTTYYPNFAPKSSSLYKGVKISDHFLPNWIPMGDWCFVCTHVLRVLVLWNIQWVKVSLILSSPLISWKVNRYSGHCVEHVLMHNQTTYWCSRDILVTSI